MYKLCSMFKVQNARCGHVQGTRASGGACVDASWVLIGSALRSIWMFLIDSALRLIWMVSIGSGLRAPQYPSTQKPIGTEYESLS